MAEKYYALMREANLSESKDREKSRNLIQELINLLDTEKSALEKEQVHRMTLERRLHYFDNYEAYVKASSVDIQNILSKRNITEQVSRPAKKKSLKGFSSSETSAVFVGFPEADMPILDEAIETQMVPTPEIQIPSPHETEVSPIIFTLFERLHDHEPIKYDDYYQFYEAVNELIPDPFAAFIREESSLIYYVGDTHGSFQEALILIDYFEQVIKANPNVKIVFLGDYVDRNPFDLENLTVIIAFFLKYRNNVVLLRGNHEDDSINKAYGFYQNLTKNFGDSTKVERIYHLILTFFIHLPIVHIEKLTQDESDQTMSIFAVHGGIPINIKDSKNPILLDEIEPEIHQAAITFKEFDPYMNWLLWADPNESLEDMIYDPNSGRSQYGYGVFNQFMEKNGFDLMVRAHEKLTDGYKFVFQKKLISLFSTSFYSDQRIGNGKILRMIYGKDPEFLPIDPKQLMNDLNALI